jgi:PAS domain S-box-containing protein
MNGKTYAYLDLAALPAVGPALLDPKPAFVFRGDGRAVLWANAAGAAFLGAPDMGAVLATEISSANPLSRQIARLAKLLPSERARLEVLRFSFGVRQATMTAACLRLNLADGARAVLAIGAVGGGRESIVTRAEALSDAIAGDECLVAVLNADGRVLGASGGFARLSPVAAEIDALIEASSAGKDRVARRSIRIGDGFRPAGVARFEAEGSTSFLLIVGPAEQPQTVSPDAPDARPASVRPKPAVARPAEPAGGIESEWEIARALDLGGPPPPRSTPPRETAAPVPITPPAPPVAVAEAEATAEPVPVGPAETAGEAGEDADLDDVARLSIEQGPRLVVHRGGEPEAPDDDEPVPVERPVEAPPRSNVVRLPGVVAPPRIVPNDRLSGSEQDAFRRIAEALGAHARPGARRPTGEPPALVETPASPARPEATDPTEAETRLLDRLPLGLVVTRDRKTLFANRAALDMLGFDTLAAFVAAGGADAIFPGESDWSRTGSGEGLMTARRRDGTPLSVEARLHAVSWGNATALMLSLREAPRRKGEEPSDELVADIAASQRRVEELETILDTATDGVIVIDGRGRIGNLNRSAEALFGIDANEVLGRPFTGLLAEESRKAALDYLDGLAANGVASVLNDGREVIGKVPNGGLIPLFMTMGRLGETGKFCAVLRDITQWKNAEEELVAARRAAEQANQQKSDFLAKISHEIRTPLNAIIGFSEVMIEEQFGPIGNERYRDYLRDIHVSGAHLMSLINDLLDLSKIEAGKLELSFEAVAVNELIQECVALMQPQANRQRIIIRTSLSAGVPNIVADPRSLRQILLNLLSNAIKFTGAGGQVIVSTALEDKGEVVIRVRDTGVGMSEKDIETALKPFRQLATTGRSRGEGTGLGLPLTKALVEANRASFAIDSAVNQGTLIRITFPTTRVLAG